MNDTPIYTHGRKVGEVRGATFYKTISAAKHFLRQPPAIAFDISTLADAERAGARIVQVTDRDTGNIYRAAIHTIRRKGIYINRGFGEQIALALKEWSVNGAPQVEQLALFGGVP